MNMKVYSVWAFYGKNQSYQDIVHTPPHPSKKYMHAWEAYTHA